MVPLTPLQNQPFCWVVVRRERGMSEPLPWSQSFQGRGEETCVSSCWPSYPKAQPGRCGDSGLREKGLVCSGGDEELLSSRGWERGGEKWRGLLRRGNCQARGLFPLVLGQSTPPQPQGAAQVSQIRCPHPVAGLRGWTMGPDQMTSQLFNGALVSVT